MTPDPEVTAMTSTITHIVITSDQSFHIARRAPGREVSGLPGQTMDRNSAITAMTLAGIAADEDVHEGHRLWRHIQGWAAEPGPTGPDAMTRVSQPPASPRHQHHREGKLTDPEAGQ